MGVVLKLLLAVVQAVVCVLSGSGGAAAQDGTVTGNRLLARLESANFEDNVWALGYIWGIAEARNGVPFYGICYEIPSAVTSKQLADTVSADLRRLPARRHDLAMILVGVSLAQHFPCASKKSSNIDDWLGVEPAKPASKAKRQ